MNEICVIIFRIIIKRTYKLYIFYTKQYRWILARASAYVCRNERGTLKFEKKIWFGNEKLFINYTKKIDNFR